MAAADRWLDTLEIRPLADRYPDELSGGQRQRTALARALAAEPRALLLDEPFAALDASLRVRLRDELRELQSRLGLPILLITHDEADVAAFADDVVRIDDGRAVPDRPPFDPESDHEDQCAQPALRPGQQPRDRRRQRRGRADAHRRPADRRRRHPRERREPRARGRRRGVRPGQGFFGARGHRSRQGAGSRRATSSRGTVARLQPGAVNAEVVIDVGGGQTVAAIITQESARSLGLAPGMAVIAVFKASSVILGVAG